jgi:hypothetical protein
VLAAYDRPPGLGRALVAGSVPNAVAVQSIEALGREASDRAMATAEEGRALGAESGLAAETEDVATQLGQHHQVPPQPRRQPQVNAALHRIAITQARTSTQGRDYVAKRIRQGNSKAEALRLLCRRLSDLVYRTLIIDEHPPPTRSSHQHSHDLT